MLIYDGVDRENEVDLMLPAQFIKPEHIRVMRKDAGGLICLAIDYNLASILGLRYMHDILKDIDELSRLVYDKTPYGDKPSFSISINHKDTFTGISDRDRALTIHAMSKVAYTALRDPSRAREEFFSNFKAPGHVPLLIARKGLIKERKGHTELSITLAKLADVLPMTVICEMLGDDNNSLTLAKAEAYAKEHNLAMISYQEIIDAYKGLNVYGASKASDSS